MSKWSDFTVEWSSSYVLSFKDCKDMGYSVTVSKVVDGDGGFSVDVSIAQCAFDIYECFDSVDRAKKFLLEFAKPFDLNLDPSCDYDFLSA